MLMSYWFESRFKGKPFYCGRKIKICDARRAIIKPPNTVPKNSQESRRKKALQSVGVQNGLLFYSLPVMDGILPLKQYQHFMLLVHAIYILLKQSISSADLTKASLLLEHFCLRAKRIIYQNFKKACQIHLSKTFVTLLNQEKKLDIQQKFINEEKETFCCWFGADGSTNCHEERQNIEIINGRELEEEKTGKFLRLKKGKDVVHSEEYTRVTRRHHCPLWLLRILVKSAMDNKLRQHKLANSSGEALLKYCASSYEEQRQWTDK
ncbi:hypothetical protein OS493_030385 [Desmophyllum pertusum]|uniref:Uncharacterized protein n=1 Tax=Desmophyllum pertusum TaxID=174260 RepID=A0A9W9Z9D6_9CNID|nr:hypothetical protein OS493_030385 [Desmophyllum pertusum]